VSVIRFGDRCSVDKCGIVARGMVESGDARTTCDDSLERISTSEQFTRARIISSIVECCGGRKNVDRQSRHVFC
jgi:hypothetical protein